MCNLLPATTNCAVDHAFFRTMTTVPEVDGAGRHTPIEADTTKSPAIETTSLDEGIQDADAKHSAPLDPALEPSSHQATTTRNEIWAYYSYGIANNGLGLFNFAPTAFQNLLSIAANADGQLLFMGQMRSVNAIVLLANGITCAINVVLFLAIGSLADYSTWRPWILIFWTVVALGISLAWLGVHDAEKWHVATGLYMVGLLVYQMCLSFWQAAFPGLARNTPHIKDLSARLAHGEVDQETFEHADMMQRNRISNVSFLVQSFVEVLELAIIVGIMFAVDVNASQEANNRGLSILIAFAGGVWILVALPWFLLEKKRPGMPLPPHTNIVTAACMQLYSAGKEIIQLKQSLLYLIGASAVRRAWEYRSHDHAWLGYFLLSDSLNTSVTVIATLQNTIVEYNTLTLTYLLLVGIGAQLIGIYIFWTIQKRFQLSTKTMFVAIMFAIVLLDGWGMIGIWTQAFGFHHLWEIWVYQAYYGLVVCPWYSYSLTMVSEVTPRGREYLFFSLFGIFGKVSAFIGPIVSSAIIDASPTDNASLPFYFLFGVSLLSTLLLTFFLDIKTSRREQAAFLHRQSRDLHLP